MIDIRLVRSDPDRARAALATVGYEAGELDALLAADARRRASIQAVEGLLAERTAASKRIRGIADAAEREQAIAAQRSSATTQIGVFDLGGDLFRFEGRERFFGRFIAPMFDVDIKLANLGNVQVAE